MRERLLQFLPEISVTGVTGVPAVEKRQKYCIFGEDASGTLLAGRGVTSVSAAPGEAVQPIHQRKNDVYQEKPNKNGVVTPVTPGTPVFAQDFIEAYEERAAIMAFDGGLSRQDAALRICIALYERGKQ